MSGPEILSKAYEIHHRYQCMFMVENNAAQDYILQFARVDPRGLLPMRAFTTGRNKAHPEFGIESLATELYNGMWIIPNTGGETHPEVLEWINEMLYYSPAAHTGDRLMASWFAREAVRAGLIKAETGRLDLHRR
ncbi:MAG: hypothetical protein KAJ19_09450, partial [Gammaproteobacteria bacterium]|nr:hypothetical protein [Gammaproteobacteria bacterium]